jgi:hypothetical protein
MLILISLLSAIIGLIGTYFIIKLAVKHGIESANKPKEDKVIKERTNDQLTTNDILIGLSILIVFVILFFSGAFN